ncbi:MAG TPA: patatin-like phospholipase family protein [Casimicrobiaceae bacterium]|nr:patatin-like phospholipase family protein [Casimicrobiaceae bacterium]
MAPPPKSKAQKPKTLRLSPTWGKHDHTVLVLQGGGALGAYQAGVFEGLAEAGIAPDWVAGVSIGAINAALIAGNEPEQRVARLREFWERVSSGNPFIPPSHFDPVRPVFNRLNAATVATFGVPGFFVPRIPSPLLAPEGSQAALSVYDTGPLLATLAELVNFRIIKKKHVRLSVGAVNVHTGNSEYFDNTTRELGPEHVLASGSLPPGFPPVHIDGKQYWDGGIVSNTPLWYVLDDSPRMNALILQVDLFSARGELPQNLDQVMERAKDIQYSSKTRFNSNRIKELDEMRDALGRVLAKLPPALRNDPDVERLAIACNQGNVSLVHLINRRLSHAASSKDYEFSRATVMDLWNSGLDAVRQAIAHPEWRHAVETVNGMRVYDLSN